LELAITTKAANKKNDAPKKRLNVLKKRKLQKRADLRHLRKPNPDASPPDPLDQKLDFSGYAFGAP